MNQSRQTVERSKRISLAALAAGVGFGLAASTLCYANPSDMYGLGAREIGMGNAFTAVADDPFAAYYNLGGLIQLTRLTLSVGVQFGHAALGDPDNCAEYDGVGCSEAFYYTSGGVLTSQQRRYGYEDPIGTHIAFALPLFPKLSLGTVAYLPADRIYDEEGNFAGIRPRLARLMTIDPYMPDYVLYQNRGQRFAAYLGLAYEIIPGLGIGFGGSVFARANLTMDIGGTVSIDSATADDGSTTTQVITALNTLMVMDMGPVLNPLAGIHWNLGTISKSLAGWQVGVTYRGSDHIAADTEVNTDLTVTTNLGEEDTAYSYGVVVDGLPLGIIDFYTPQQVAFGFTGLIADRFRLAVDATWNDWSAYRVSQVTVPDSVDLGLGATATVVNARVVDTSNFRDTIMPRFGMEGRLGPFATGSRFRGVDVFLRVGGGFEPNPFGEQTGLTNLLNSDRILGHAGVGVNTHNPFAGDRALPVSIDLAFQMHYLVPMRHIKDFDAGDSPPDGYPIDGQYVSQGTVMQGALTFQFGF